MERLVEELYTFKGKVEDCENDYIISVQEKLREYENAEEQGLLLRLPCKVGTLVYQAYSIGGISGIDEHRLKLEDISEFGKTVFLTKEEAKQELKEMEGE